MIIFTCNGLSAESNTSGIISLAKANLSTLDDLNNNQCPVNTLVIKTIFQFKEAAKIINHYITKMYTF